MEIRLPHISDLAAGHALVMMTHFVCYLLHVSQDLLSNNISQRETPDDVFKMHAKLNDHEAHAGVSLVELTVVPGTLGLSGRARHCASIQVQVFVPSAFSFSSSFLGLYARLLSRKGEPFCEGPFCRVA